MKIGSLFVSAAISVGFISTANIAAASPSSYAPSLMHHTIDVHCPTFSAKLEYANSVNSRSLIKPTLSKVVLDVNGKSTMVDLTGKTLPESLAIGDRTIIERVSPSCYEKTAISFAVFFVDTSKQVGTVPGTVTQEERTTRLRINVYENGNVKLN